MSDLNLEKRKYSVNFKIITIIILSLILLIPTIFVNELIYERQRRKNNVIREISNKWGENQIIGGPVISIPYNHVYQDKDNKVISTLKYIHFLPESLDIKTDIDTEKRYRGIYETVLYNSKIKINASFNHPDIKDLSVDPNNIYWNKAFVSIGISDMKGIKEKINSFLNNKKIFMDPGIECNDIFASGVHSKINLNSQEKLVFDFQMDLNGSRQIHFLPVGETTTLNINSSWQSPSFDGQYLPYERKIDESGFKAYWKILHLNRNYPQTWIGNRRIYNSSFGVSLFIPTDIYQKSSRTAKYAIMFIVFTFVAFFLSEVMNRKKIHPIQYLLVGFALIVFYTLLIAISEHINFNIAYIISALSIITLITLYSRSVLKIKSFSYTVGSILSILYLFLYILLQLEDYALLFGSIGLFIVLASTMYATRKIDWYE